MIPRLLASLPALKCAPESSENKLITRFLVPILQGLFDHKEDGKQVEVDFIDCMNPESQYDTRLSRSHPDAVITSGKNTIGYIEVKPITEQVNTHKINKGLVRLGVFSKNAIDLYRLSSCLAIQAVGNSVVFYLVQYINDNLYIMTELDQLYFSSSVEEIPLLWGFMDNLFHLVHIFQTKCMENNHRPLSSNSHHCESLRSPVLRAVVSPSTSRKRKSAIQYNYYQMFNAFI